MRAHMVYICGGGQPVAQPCPKGGPDHTPWPMAYTDASEYADQLLLDGWTTKQCPRCRLWVIWIPPMPMPQPPNRYVYDDEDFRARVREMYGSGSDESSPR